MTFSRCSNKQTHPKWIKIKYSMEISTNPIFFLAFCSQQLKGCFFALKNKHRTHGPMLAAYNSSKDMFMGCNLRESVQRPNPPNSLPVVKVKLGSINSINMIQFWANYYNLIERWYFGGILQKLPTTGIWANDPIILKPELRGCWGDSLTIHHILGWPTGGKGRDKICPLAICLEFVEEHHILTYSSC